MNRLSLVGFALACAVVAMLAVAFNGSRAEADEGGGDPPEIRPFGELVVAEMITTDEMVYLLDEFDAQELWRIRPSVEITLLSTGGGSMLIVGESKLSDDQTRWFGQSLAVDETLVRGGVLHDGDSAVDDAVIMLSHPDIEDTLEVEVPAGTFIAVGEFVMDTISGSCTCGDGSYACCSRNGLNVQCECIPSGQSGDCQAGGPTSDSCAINPTDCSASGCSDGCYACCNENPQNGRWECLCVSQGNCQMGGSGATGCSSSPPLNYLAAAIRTYMVDDL